MAHGNIYAPDKIDASLANYFRAGNLGALRELALLWVADKVDVGLEEYRERHGITKPWETRERVVVAVTGAPGTEALIRRAARIAQRAHGELLGVHVSGDEGLAGSSAELLDQHRKLLEDVGGEFHEVAGADVAAALVEFATAENATQLVLGASHRSRWEELLRGSVINRTVHALRADRRARHLARGGRPIVVERGAPTGPIAPPDRSRPCRRAARLAGWLLAAAGVPLLTLLLAQLRESTGLPTVLLAYLALVVIVVGRRRDVAGDSSPPIAAFLCANWFFTPPLHEWTIAEGENVVALFVFLGIALGVSRIVDIVRPARHGSGARPRPRPHPGQIGGDDRRRGPGTGAAAEPALGVRPRFRSRAPSRRPPDGSSRPRSVSARSPARSTPRLSRSSIPTSCSLSMGRTSPPRIC